MKFYIASALENAERVRQTAAMLKIAGHEHSYDWTVHGSVQHEGPARIAEVAANELKGVENADVVIVMIPGGRGTHAELGMAFALQKRIVICAPDAGAFMQDERTCAFYHSPRIVHIDESRLGRKALWQALVTILRNYDADPIWVEEALR